MMIQSISLFFIISYRFAIENGNNYNVLLPDPDGGALHAQWLWSEVGLDWDSGAWKWLSPGSRVGRKTRNGEDV